MLLSIVNWIMRSRQPDKHGPGFFAWNVLNWVGLTLRYGDDLRRADLPLTPIAFLIYVVEGEVLLHTWPDGREMHTYQQPRGDTIGVHAVAAGQWFKVHAGAPAMVELNPTREAVEISFPWLDEPKAEKRAPAKMIILRLPC